MAAGTGASRGCWKTERKFRKQATREIARKRMCVCMHMHAHIHTHTHAGRQSPACFQFFSSVTCHAWELRDGRAQHVFKFSIFKVSTNLSCMRIEGRQSPRFVYVWFVLFVNFVKVVMLFWLEICLCVCLCMCARKQLHSRATSLRGCKVVVWEVHATAINKYLFFSIGVAVVIICCWLRCFLAQTW